MAELLATPTAQRVIGCAIDVHRALGPGLLESVYETCLAEELAHERIAFARQVGIPLVYRNARMTCAFRADLIVEGQLLIELKTVEHLLPIHKSQVFTYLKLLRLRQGLLINFNVSKLTDGLKSVLG